MPTYRNVSGGWITFTLPGEHANYGCKAGDLITLAEDQVPHVIGPQVPESAVELVSEAQDTPATIPTPSTVAVEAPVAPVEPERTPEHEAPAEQAAETQSPAPEHEAPTT